METRWKHTHCGYNLTKEEIRANVKEGSLNKPSSLIVSCPGCIEAVCWFDLVPFILHDENNNGPRTSSIRKEEKKKEKIEILKKKKFRFKRKDSTKFKRK